MATIIAQLPRSACADRLVYPRLQNIHDLYLGLPNPGIGQVADGPRDISLPALQVYLLSPLRSNKNLGIHKTLFYGQPLGQAVYPDAHLATWIDGRVSAGTVVAAECCYGAELYDPAPRESR